MTEASIGVFPNLRVLTLALMERREERGRGEFIAALHRLDPSIRILGSLCLLKLGCSVRTLVRHLERFNDDDTVWLLASLMATVAESDDRRVPWPFVERHLGAPIFGVGADGRALAYWLDQARRAMPRLRRYWLNHLMAVAAAQDSPAWLVWPRTTLRQAMEMSS